MPERIPDLCEVQRLLNRWLSACYPAWRSCTITADVGEAVPLTVPVPRANVPVADAAPARDVAFVPTPFQMQILDALDGRALRTEPLAQAVGCDRRSLFRKPGGIAELLEHGLVEKHPRLGYHRPDAPPPQLEDGA